MMTCLFPPELDEATLLRYLDDEPGVGIDRKDVARHLAQCPSCRQRAARLALVQKRLRRGLHRSDCPSTLELGDFHLHLLARRQAAAVARHVRQCPHCRAELERLDEFLGAVAPDLQAGAAQRIKVWVAQLVSAGGELGRMAGSPPALAPAYAALRGEQPASLLYRAGEAQIAIAVQPDAERPGRVVLLALVTGIAAAGWSARLWREDRQVAQAVVDELGNLVMAGLAPGVYDLALAGVDTEIHVTGLEVRGA
jgi:hypothetical protein